MGVLTKLRLRVWFLGVAFLLAAADAASAGWLSGRWRVDYFPGPYFDEVARDDLHREVLQRWPGPTALVEMWRTEELSLSQRRAILLGAAAYHDPQLLPIYIAAIRDPEEKLRQAAAYGYRSLLGDVCPDVRAGVPPQAAAALEGEMVAVAATLRQASLAELWAASLLAAEGTSLPGWRGVLLRRPALTCVKALDRIATVEDLAPIALAYQLARDKAIRIGLLRFLEAFTLQRLVVKPQGPRAAWGSREYDSALAAADLWVEARCSFDPLRELEDGLARLGIRGLDPMGAEACVLWQELLLNGPPQWRGTASRMLYRCGGPALFVDRFDPDSERSGKVWRRLLEWYRLGGADAVESASRGAPSPNP